MSFVRMADLHPGRCQNYRAVLHADGYTESLRCLDYEDVPHQCEFPPTAHRLSSVSSLAGSSYTVPKPVPWRKPVDRDRFESSRRPVSFATEPDPS